MGRKNLVRVVVYGTLLALVVVALVRIDTREELEPAAIPDLLADDRLEDKRPEFDPGVWDSRPVGPGAERWQLNASGAVIGLDVEDLHPERDAEFNRLYPDFVSAAGTFGELLPSVNLVAAKAKQFDDGLYAAMDRCMAREGGAVVQLVRRALAELEPGEPAYAWLYGALEVGGLLDPGQTALRPAAVGRLVREFQGSGNERPVGFYDWNEELGRAFRFLRWLQQPIPDGLVERIRLALESTPGGFDLYRRMLGFYRGLGNPPAGPALFAEGRPAYFLPWTRSHEFALYERLFPLGLSPGADLMREFIRAIREGRVDLRPTRESGWYDYQLHALETFLLPGGGEESGKLLLTAKYKQRLLEAFKALVTRHRETHLRGLVTRLSSDRPPVGEFGPRLRVEPNPTFFLRMARGYRFLQAFLAAAGAWVPDLDTLRGAREGGWREAPLGEELEWMCSFFYGLYLVSCEDIGLRPALQRQELGEPEMAEGARALALEWLENWRDDPDLRVDARVCAPVYEDQERRRYWGTIGVRALRLEAGYARAPAWRPWPGEGEPQPWRELPADLLRPARYVLLVDEFAEFDRPGAVLTRGEFRALCDRGVDRLRNLPRPSSCPAGRR